MSLGSGIKSAIGKVGKVLTKAAEWAPIAGDAIDAAGKVWDAAKQRVSDRQRATGESTFEAAVRTAQEAGTAAEARNAVGSVPAWVWLGGAVLLVVLLLRKA